MNFDSAKAYMKTRSGGGSDQIQPHIISERILGLQPKKIEVDRNMPFRDVNLATKAGPEHQKQRSDCETGLQPIFWDATLLVGCG